MMEKWRNLVKTHGQDLQAVILYQVDVSHVQKLGSIQSLNLK